MEQEDGNEALAAKGVIHLKQAPQVLLTQQAFSLVYIHCCCC
jgi:hypothetical protein